MSTLEERSEPRVGKRNIAAGFFLAFVEGGIGGTGACCMTRGGAVAGALMDDDAENADFIAIFDLRSYAWPEQWLERCIWCDMADILDILEPYAR